MSREAGGLEVVGVTSGYGSMVVLRDVSLTVGSGSITLLTGPNGAGRTTLLRTVLGSVQPSSGTVSVCGEDVTALSPASRLEGLLGWVPEGRALFGSLTVRENLRVAARSWGVPRSRVTERVSAVSERFGAVGDRLDVPLSNLSGGQQQAVAIARAFLVSPRVLLLDEPSTGLSPAAWHEVLATCRLAAEAGAAVLLVEQRLREALHAVDRVGVMVGGRIVVEAAAGEGGVDEAELRRHYFSIGADL